MGILGARGLRNGVLVALAVWEAGTAWAVPTRQEAYRNDDLGVVVYRDSADSEVYWYVPVVKPMLDAEGKVVFRKRQRANGNTDYTFYLIPQLPDDLAEFVANEIPGLHNRQQLKPVMAKRFGLQIKQFNSSALSDEVSDYRYLNQPQLVRLSLNAEDAADFDDLFSAAPGVPVNLAITFESERVQKYLQIELTYREVFTAMNIAASGRYTFTKAEIESKMSDYLANKYLTIKSKGDLKIPEVVEKVIQQCFTPAHLTQPGRNTLTGALGAVGGELARVATADELKRKSEAEARLRQRGLSVSLAAADAAPRPATTPAAGPGASGGAGDGAAAPAPVDASAEFTFKRELANRNERFLYLQEQMTDSQEIVVIPTFLAGVPAQASSRKVTPLPARTVLVQTDHDPGHPLRTGVLVRAGDQWTLNAAFTLSAKSPYGNGGLAYYRWDASWPRVDSDLYYRVGSGPWLKVGGRALVGSDSFQSGEIQLYLDRPAIWNKIPEDYRSTSLLGTLPAIFPYNRTYFEFNVTLTGHHVEGRGDSR